MGTNVQKAREILEVLVRDEGLTLQQLAEIITNPAIKPHKDILLLSCRVITAGEEEKPEPVANEGSVIRWSENHKWKDEEKAEFRHWLLDLAFGRAVKKSLALYKWHEHGICTYVPPVRDHHWLPLIQPLLDAGHLIKGGENLRTTYETTSRGYALVEAVRLEVKQGMRKSIFNVL